METILLGICQKLQLQPSSYKQAEERYHVIADKIQEDPVFEHLELKMYPQGSFRLKTTVKPLKGEEYDLDFVVELPTGTSMTPKQLYDHIIRILSNDGVHNGMVEPKSRCVRVNYANDFHMDIMPGQLLNDVSKEIIVPDRELKQWYHHSNPIRYAEWFEEQAKTQILFELNEARRVQCSAEPIDDQEVAVRLEPLRRAVQLIKRYRDIYCEENKTNAVRSIVICTLMGHISSSYSNTLDIILDFCNYVNGKISMASGKPFEVCNPVVDEILTEKWEENIQNYHDFVCMIHNLTEDVSKLRSLTINNEMIEMMKKMFGENVTNAAVKENAAKVNVSRNTGTLAIGATGILNTGGAGIPVKKNTFYGE